AAVPLRGAGRAVAAVSVSGRGGHLTLERLAPLLQTCARAVWAHLYGPGRAARFAPPAEVPSPGMPVVMDSLMSWARSANWM
ncbi:IclR family transcriptional regulator, partial [Streptomyces sp. SID14478]|nr:IclR family transcriptional regulator [Streptomyces sp. SID14478]